MRIEWDVHEDPQIINKQDITLSKSGEEFEARRKGVTGNVSNQQLLSF